MRRTRIIKLSFFLALLVATLLALLAVKNILVSFLLATVLYFTLAPARDFLERRGLGVGLATALPFLIFLGGIGILAAYLAPGLSAQAVAIRGDLPRYRDTVAHFAFQMHIALAKYLPTESAEKILGILRDAVLGYGQRMAQDVPSLVSNSITILFLTPVLAFFMLRDGRSIMRGIFSMVPNNLFELALSLSHQISSQVGDFVRARFVETILYSAFLGIFLLLMDFPYAFLLSLVGGILNIVPYIGPLIGAAPAFLVAASQGMDSKVIYQLIALYVGAQIFDLVLIVPFLVAKIINLHPLLVVVSIILGSKIMGILGMVIALPVTGTLKIIFESLYTHLTGNPSASVQFNLPAGESSR